MTITEVAGEVGYPDANYFSKVFSKQMKTSPTEYKKLNTKRKSIGFIDS